MGDRIYCVHKIEQMRWCILVGDHGSAFVPYSANLTWQFLYDLRPIPIDFELKGLEPPKLRYLFSQGEPSGTPNGLI